MVGIFKDSTSFTLVNDTGERHDRWADRKKWTHFIILHRLINFMRSRGWTIENDKETHKCIREDYWIGKKKDLEFRLHRYPRGFAFDFYQNLVYENRHGGRYDFDRYKKMPYLIKLLFLNETRHMKAFLEGLEIKNLTDRSPVDYKTAEDKIKLDYVESCHRAQKTMDEFSLSDLDGITSQHSNSTDRDKKTIYNGQIKYFRHWNGRLMRGKVYHNINNMWWVIINKKEYKNIASFDLFDPTEEDYKMRRDKKGNPPKAIAEKMQHLKNATTKELLKELKNRGYKKAI